MGGSKSLRRGKEHHSHYHCSRSTTPDGHDLALHAYYASYLLPKYQPFPHNVNDNIDIVNDTCYIPWYSSDRDGLSPGDGSFVPLFNAISSGRGHWRGLVDTLLRMGRGWGARQRAPPPC
eukprot:scaffold19903_cov169-Isochrysis_galbana.AAC.2